MTRKKAWEGRLSGGLDPLFESFNCSLAVDRRLLAVELEQDLAWANALARAGVYGPEELAKVRDGLAAMLVEEREGTFPFAETDEDVHMAVERRLTELCGPPGEKLQTGRSRNDQVGTSLRMYLRAELARVDASLLATLSTLVTRAESEIATPMPGLTHLQPAQVLSLGHYLLSCFWALSRDVERVRAAGRRADRMPLGSGALAGTTLNVDRKVLAAELGFARPSENSLDAVGDRDLVAEVSFALAQTLAHLSRYAEDWVLWCSPALGFMRLPDRLATGSSLMPQKKNPDSLELIRGKAATAIGQVCAILSLQKGLPISYNKDLQEDKAGLFSLLDSAWQCVEVFRRVAEAFEPDRARMRAALTDDLYATDLADYLVKKGLPFRSAHEAVGRLVRAAAAAGLSLSKLPLAAYLEASAHFDARALELYDPEVSLARRNVAGGTGAASVAAQLEAARSLLTCLHDPNGSTR
ncbi:MAG: argininosuccinate lyase [Candidatus Wallbacteria bacterium]|nr:argininosuccinate lyase [Candidatus Wallbacteria bacterium]